jgi:lysozyme
MPVNRRPIFLAVKQLRGGQGFTPAEVAILDAGIDAAFAEAPAAPPVALPPSSGRHVSAKGIALMHSFENCELEAYPDPGSRDGNPWTVGWGSTGPDIKRGTRWTQEQADARFAVDLASFAAKVDALIGDAPTTQEQFDAMVSLAYNIGIGSTNPAKPGGFTRSTTLRKHKAGDYHGAAAAFLMWDKNDGKVMRGLQRRRAAEADLYDGD